MLLLRGQRTGRAEKGEAREVEGGVCSHNATAEVSAA